MNYVLLAKLAAVGLILASAAGAGWHFGSARVQGKWDAAELQRDRELAESRAEQQRLANTAAARFERDRQALAENLAGARRAVAAALAEPLQCPASGRLADLVVPGAALDGLRAASGAASAPGAAAGGAPGPVLARPGDP